MYKVIILIIELFLGTRVRPNKMKQQSSIEKKEEEKVETPAAQVQVEIIDEPVKEVKEERKEEDDVKDSWDADTTEDEQEDEGIIIIYIHYICTHTHIQSSYNYTCIIIRMIKSYII